MEGVKIQVELPSDLVIALDIEPTALEHQATEWILLALIQEGRISTGKAAEVLGLTKQAMIDLLDRRGHAYLNGDAGEVDSDLQVALKARRIQQ